MKEKTTLLIFMGLFISVIIILIVFELDLTPNTKSRYDSGYKDGYAESYNTLCKNKVTNIEGDWEDKNYYSGYLAGQLSGAAKCDAEKRAQLSTEKG